MMDGSSKHERRLEKSRRLRERGRRHFIVWSGVIGWGVPTALLFSVGMAWWLADRTFLDVAPLAIVVFPIGGYFWGAVMWSWFEREWKRQEANDPA